MKCIVELFGAPRQLMKASEVELKLPPGASLQDIVTTLAQREARLLGNVIAPDVSALIFPYSFYRVGRSFVNDLSQKVESGDRFLLMSTGVGG